MKTTLKLMLALSVPLLLLAAADQPVPNRIATIDLKKVFDKYYKLDLARQAFEKEEGDMEKQLKSIATETALAQDDYKKLLDAANDSMISDKEKAARQAKADAKQDEIKSDQTELTTFQQQAKDTLALHQQRMMDLLMQDIQTAINAKARAAGFTLVLDTSARVANGANTAVVLYSNGDNDITDEISKQLNAAAPASAATNVSSGAALPDGMVK